MTEANNVSELIELAERCQAATGPDRGLDYQLDYVRCDWLVIPPPPSDEEWAELERLDDLPPKFTGSLDAALMLIWEHGELGLAFSGDRWSASIYAGGVTGSGATRPLALCAAALRARQGYRAASRRRSQVDG